MPHTAKPSLLDAFSKLTELPLKQSLKTSLQSLKAGGLSLHALMHSSTFIRLWLLRYPPYVGASIRTTHVDLEGRLIRVEMPLTALNKNAVGTQFGGSLYSMVDPHYMVILLHHLGDDHVVWDQAANIRFIAPGRRRVWAEISLTLDEIEEIRRLAADHMPVHRTYTVQIKDQANKIIAEVDKVLYIRRKKGH